MEALAPIFFSTTVIISLFFSTDLIIELDFKVFLTVVLTRLPASINREKEWKDKFSR